MWRRAPPMYLPQNTGLGIGRLSAPTHRWGVSTMNTTNISLATVLFLCGTAQIHAQVTAVPQRQDQVPIYRVTVIGRSIKAVNFGNRNIPTKMGFRGTVLQPDARGEATVES